MQVGSHVHLPQANAALEFDRAAAHGHRLDIPAGTAVRFEPGVAQHVSLVPLSGTREVHGLSLESARPIGRLMTELSRARYAALFGPTTGDRIRLADTDLFVEITEDRSGGPGLAGDEAVFGGGKVLRESMGQGRATRADGAPDTVITGAVIIDYWGIIKADIGIRDGRIVAIGKAGNPDTMTGVHPDLVVGPSTEIISGNGRIVTAGAIDCHVHLICPQIMEEALGGGITTIIAGGTGPAEGSKATTVTPGAWHLARILESLDTWPLNIALLGKGNTVSAEAMWEQLRGGAAGFKLHEDWGTTPAAIDACLDVAEASGVQVNIHTDTLNEMGFVEDTLAAIGGRSIHAYHTEGAGGGHAPDIITVAGRVPCAAEFDEPDPAAHRQHARRASRHVDGVPSPEPKRPRGSRLRREPHPTVDDRRRGSAARHRRHLDDRQRRPGHGPHRRGRAAHLADGACDEAPPRCTTGRRPRRQQPRPPLRREIHHLPGGCAWAGFGDRLRRGRQAGRPGAVGARVLRGPTACGGQGRHDRVGGDGRRECVHPDATAGIAAADVRGGARRGRGHDRCTSCRRRRSTTSWPTGSPSIAAWSPVSDVRKIGKADMPLNDALPRIEVEPDTFTVRIDGEVWQEQPAAELPMAQRYFLF